MNNLTEIERIRLTIQTAKNLKELKRFGLSKSKFMRDAINEKLIRDVPKLISKQNSLKNLIKCPF